MYKKSTRLRLYSLLICYSQINLFLNSPVKKIMFIYMFYSQCLQQEHRSEITCNGVSLVREKVSTDSKEDEENYVYDIYYVNSGRFDFRELENDLTVEALFQDQMVYDEYRASECTEVYDDDDDSNDEDNWRNDYPDEDPRFFENEGIEYQYGDGEFIVLQCT